MASNDHIVLPGGLTLGVDVAAGPTRGQASPPGGGAAVYAMKSLSGAPGVYALYADPQAPNTGFNPMSLGGFISMAMKASAPGVAALIYMALQGTADAAHDAYALGLSDGDACHIELRKGPLATGLPNEAPGGPNVVLARSSTTIPRGSWCHLKLEVVANLNGDVLLNAWMNDLAAQGVDAPVWTAIPGIPLQLIDDAAAVRTGSLPLVGGRCGFGARFTAARQFALFDRIQLLRQT